MKKATTQRMSVAQELEAWREAAKLALDVREGEREPVDFRPENPFYAACYEGQPMVIWKSTEAWKVRLQPDGKLQSGPPESLTIWHYRKCGLRRITPSIEEGKVKDV